MNKGRILAWIDDFEVSAYLAKLVTLHSYVLEFNNSVELIQEMDDHGIFIIDLNCIKEDELKKINNRRTDHYFIILGFCKEINGTLINYYSDLGCDIVLQRQDLLNNLNSIISKAFHAC